VSRAPKIIDLSTGAKSLRTESSRPDPVTEPTSAL